MPVDWDHRYSSTGKYVYGKDPNACVVEAVSNKWLPGQGRVLLIGEGEGRNAVYLASQGFECVASDPSQRALEKAEKLAAATVAIAEERDTARAKVRARARAPARPPTVTG